MLKAHFSGLRLSDVHPDQIEAYKEARLADGVEPATINHDLRVLKRMMRIAERKQLISRNPFVAVDFLKQRAPRLPHILTFAEEDRLLRVAVPYLRILIILILETGMRSHREALALRWESIDFVNDFIRVRESKTRAGIRNIPISARCRTELLWWRSMLGPEFSAFVFPNLRTPAKPMRDVRYVWGKALKDAGMMYFCIYNLRHTFASRLSAAGVSDLFVAQMIGHSTPGILQKYSKAIDEYRRDADPQAGTYAGGAHNPKMPYTYFPLIDVPGLPRHNRYEVLRRKWTGFGQQTVLARDKILDPRVGLAKVTRAVDFNPLRVQNLISHRIEEFHCASQSC
jgi:integrase